MQELVTRGQADAILGIGLPILGLALAVLGGALRRSVRSALAWGGAPVLAGALWWVYNALADRMGLGSALGLALNAALFIGVGAAIGLALRRLDAAKEQPCTNDSTDSPTN